MLANKFINLSLLGVFISGSVLADDKSNQIYEHPYEGRYIYCKSNAAIKKDFLAQLQAHQIYGNPELIDDTNQKAAAIAEYYQENLVKRQLTKRKHKLPRLLKDLKVEELHNGAEISDYREVFKVGDVILNMDFLNKKSPGTFYSKRGMAHARIVVEVNQNNFKTHDGGWGSPTNHVQISSQSVWLRPSQTYFDSNGGNEDIKNLLQILQAQESAKYDNTLTDDLPTLRARLHNSLDDLFELEENEQKRALLAKKSLKKIIKDSTPNPDKDFDGFAPYGDATNFNPKTGNYCSEAGSNAFSLLGFRIFGEVPFETINAFNKDGKLPKWEIYANALEGFGAASGGVFMVHKLYNNYFQLMQSLWENPQTRAMLKLKPGKFTDSISAFVQTAKELSHRQSGRDLIKESLQKVIAVTQDATKRGQLKALVENMEKVANDLHSKGVIDSNNISQASYKLFFDSKNQAYGPFHFLENGEFFELQGVFYNTTRGNFQAKWVADSPRYGNMSTTLYQLKPEMEEDTCKIGEAAGSVRSGN